MRRRERAGASHDGQGWIARDHEVSQAVCPSLSWRQRLRLRRGAAFVCLTMASLLLRRIYSHASPGDFIFDDAVDSGGLVAAALLRPRPALIVRARFMEPWLHTVEALEFIEAMDPYFYIAAENSGMPGLSDRMSRSPEQRRRLERLLAPERASFVRSHIHSVLNFGPISDLQCPAPPSRGMAPKCIARIALEGDRVANHIKDTFAVPGVSGLWVRSSSQAKIFSRASIPDEKLSLTVIPTPIDMSLFDPTAERIRRLGPLPLSATAEVGGGGGSPERGDECEFYFLAVFAFGQEAGWDVLIRAYLHEFSRAESVCLLLLTHSPDGVGVISDSHLRWVQGQLKAMIISEEEGLLGERATHYRALLQD
jgi:hypothetical protein